MQRLRENRYTCAIDFQGLYKSSILAGLSGAGRRIGFDRAWAREEGAAMFYTERVIPTGPPRCRVELFLGGAGRRIAPGNAGVSAARPGRWRGIDSRAPA